ncbi:MULTISPECIES: glycosyltransferase [Photobacterium]|uniref:Glycosyltransferase subfamily 4-like N-terminal domain-containing protein n=1 Tax=Photobacterium malacitanum TaxID=2204294 RepID=A0A1Y6MNN6_9GAMM|nr:MULTISPECIES: glycosyltransferase [Photobacterium]SMY38166.1 hypothetical protein PMAL9190_03399 [Photobacterium malacitanum]
MNKKIVLYLSYTGILEPLGQSQILAYLTRLSCSYRFILITFEKKDDFDNKIQVDKLKSLCYENNIIWKPRIYHKKPRLFATSWDLTNLIFDIYKLNNKYKFDFMHCRSYIPSIAAYLARKVIKLPFIFDMRALWLEEMVDDERLKKDSIIYKMLKFFERELFNDSAAIVSLTNAALPYILNQNPTLSKDKFSVIPTCVDLTRFKNDIKETNQDIIIGTMGTIISGWYYSDWLFQTLKLSEKVFKSSKVKLITKDDQCFLYGLAKEYSISEIEIKSSKPEDIQSNINDMTFAILYFTSGISKIGSAPTRMAEFLACGIPILGNEGVGDMANLIKKFNIGVVVKNNSEQDLITALNEMKSLLADPDCSRRCKQAALELFSADVGAKRYNKIYQRVSYEKNINVYQVFKDGC